MSRNQDARQFDEEIHLQSSAVYTEDTRAPYIDNLVLSGLPELLSKDDQGKTVLNLAVLQRMVLFQLEVDIIEKVGPLARRQFNGRNPLRDQELKKALADYAQGVRDWDLMVDHQLKATRDKTPDPFSIISDSRLLKKAMEDNKLPELAGNLTYPRGGLDKEVGTFRQRTKLNKARRLKTAAQKFTMAMFGGVSLIGPMLLMVYWRDLTVVVVTTSLAVIIFAGILAWYSNGEPVDIVSAVAAYAAVLVVFVGTIQG
ncbi:hypothetical protein QBC38DRAFT_471664 [Podospora fimiseda]|uniref:DUF6594 domain-containing protein n=1 Tax=Podospora fimiseda TaxID=252190 RepID=A0AAN7H1Z3_9PEZI|nr:hypothetical protein QBC38DRAFT_471664 [Podospora fimiseda]